MPLLTAQSAESLGMPGTTTQFPGGCFQSLLGSSPDCFMKPLWSAGQGSTKASLPGCKVSKWIHKPTYFPTSSVGWSYHTSDSIKFSDTSTPLEGVGTFAAFFFFPSHWIWGRQAMVSCRGLIHWLYFFSWCLWTVKIKSFQSANSAQKWFLLFESGCH